MMDKWLKKATPGDKGLTRPPSSVRVSPHKNLMTETLTKIKPIDPSGLSKRESHQERKCSHSESNCPVNILHNKMSMQEKQTCKVIIDETSAEIVYYSSIIVYNKSRKREL